MYVCVCVCVCLWVLSHEHACISNDVLFVSLYVCLSITYVSGVVDCNLVDCQPILSDCVNVVPSDPDNGICCAYCGESINHNISLFYTSFIQCC